MSIRWRLALAFLAILALFALNIGVYFDGIGKRSASFEEFNQAVQRQSLVIDLQRQLDALTDVVRNLNLLAQADLESANLDPDQAEEKTRELDGMMQIARRLDLLSGSQSSVDGDLQIDTAESVAGHRLPSQFEPLQQVWGHYFQCLSLPSGAERLAFVQSLDAAGAAEPENPLAPATAEESMAPSGDGALDALDAEDTDDEGDGETDADAEEILDVACPDPELHRVAEISTSLRIMERSERQQVEQERVHFSKVAKVTNRRILTLFGVSTVVAIVVALFFSAYLGRGLTALKSGARRIGQGDLEYRIPERGKDELAELAHAFNDMSGNLLTARSKVEEARAAAEDANRAKSTFLANMSHELRTPMNAIIGYSEMLIEEAEDLEQDDFIPDLQRILAASNHLLELINDVLDLSKIEAGKMTLFLEDFRVESMIGDVTSTIRPLVAKNRNHLELDLGDSLGDLRADETKVRQTLFNLLSNACKFTSDGTIRLTAQRRPTPKGDRFSFQVADTGIGMSETQMARIFDEFTQADPSTTRKFGGTGLGLTISKRFCQIMGGDLTVSSRPQEGTTFTIDLPAIVVPVDEPNVPSPVRAPAASSPAAAPSEPPSHGGSSNSGSSSSGSRDSDSRGTVLVIDDDDVTLDLTRRILEKEEGFEVVTCNNGSDGLKQAKHLRPHAILLDIMMPRMDGWQVLSALQADDVTRHIPVLLISMLDAREMGYALGASDYLNKPLSRARLRSHLAKLTQQGDDSGHLLVVDDDPDARNLLKRSCQKDGWRVSEAENGLVALGMIEEQRPDLILLDLAMPQMDGFEFLGQLRQSDHLADLPVVVVSARDLDEEERKRLGDQADAVLRKGSVSAEEVLEEVRRQVRA